MQKDLETRTLGKTGMVVTQLGYGAGFRGEVTETQADGVFNAVLDAGINFIDTSIDYGQSEESIGKCISHRRSEYFLATKCGCLVAAPQPQEPTAGPRPHLFTRENIEAGVHQSLIRMKTDYIDLLQFHLSPSKETLDENDAMETVVDLQRQGKVRFIGLSEASPATIRRAHAIHPISALQSEYSLWTRDPQEEVLPLLRELGIGLVPYAPLGRGFLTGAFRSLDSLDGDDWRRNNPRFIGENLQRNLRIVDEVEAVAAETGATSAQVALAWLLSHDHAISPIPGTTRIERVQENAGADRLVLSDDQVGRLTDLPAASGDRYDPANMTTLNG